VQRRFFAQFGCRFNTYGWFSRIFFSKTYFASFLHFFASIIFAKSLRNANKNFPIFSRNVSFAANPSYYTIKRKILFYTGYQQTGLPTKVYNCFFFKSFNQLFKNIFAKQKQRNQSSDSNILLVLGRH